MIKYEWYWMLPEQFRPDDAEPERIHALDALRQSWSLDHMLFSDIIMQSYWTTKRIQRQLYDDEKKLYPELSDKLLFKEIIMSRTISRIPMGLDISEEEVERVVDHIESIEELIEYIIKKEREDESPDPNHMRRKMNDKISRIMEEQNTPIKIKTDLFTRFRNRMKVLITSIKTK
jgi:Asp-tRNA(Asn)/Glu-tRNA(Gln) amidotransferase C subunit